MEQSDGWSLSADALIRVRRLNLNLLYSLHALLHAPSLTAAAHANAISQPAMSMKLRRLREHFSDQLIVFGERRQLTALGEALKHRIAYLLREVDDTFNLTLHFDPATTRETITIAAPEAIELIFLSRLIHQIREIAPDIAVRTVPFLSGSVMQLFNAGVDVAIVPEVMADDRLSAQPLLAHTMTGMVWRHHPLARQLVSEDRYLACRHAALHHDVERAMFGEWDAASPLARREVFTRTGLYSMLPLLAVESDLVVTTSTWFAQFCASHYPLDLVMLDFQQPSSLLVAQWQPYRDREPMVRWLLAELRRAVDKIGKSIRKNMAP